MHASLAISLLALLPLVRSHGYLKKVEAAGQINDAPAPWDTYQKMPTTASRIGYNSNQETKFAIFASDFSDASVMSCGPSSNKPAPSTVKVQAGQSVDLYWAGSTGELDSFSDAPAGFHPWVHAMGPVTDMLAPCDGNDCTSFDATNAKWTVMAKAGVDPSQTISQELRGLMGAKPEVYQPKTGSGLWAMAKLIEDGSKWTLDIPANLAPGQYLWRNEISAVHTSPAQIYVGCVQLEVTGSGNTQLPAGVTSDKLYSRGNMYENFNAYTYDYSKTFEVPGPAVWDGASSGSSSPSVSVSVSTGKSSGSSSSSEVSAPEQDNEAPAPAAEKQNVPSPVPKGSMKSCRRKRSIRREIR